MKRHLTILLLVLLVPPVSRATSDSLSHVTLALHGGAGYGLYRESGASPLTYRGLELHPGFSVRVEKASSRYEAYLLASGGGYGLKARWSYFQAYGGHPVVGFRASFRMPSAAPWQLWVGGSVDDLFDIRYTSSLGNANFGYGNFLRLNVEALLEYHLQRWRFHAAVAFTPMAITYRPGFAYMDNFDQELSNPVANTFDQYVSYLVWAPGTETSLGATFMMRSGNTVGLSYYWNYLTSRVSPDRISAPHRFDYAGHALILTLGIRLH